MSFTRKIAHNTLIQFGGKIFGTVLGVVTIAIMTRYLGAQGFGQYTTIIAFLQLFAILIDFGLAISVLQLMAHPDNDEKRILNNVFTLRLFSAIIMMSLAPIVSLFFPYPSIIKIGIALTSAAFIFNSLNQVLIGVFQKKLKMGQSTFAEVVGRTVLMVVVIIAVVYNYGLLGVLVAQIIASAITFLINLLLSRRLIPFTLAFEWPIWKKIWSTTWPIAVSVSLNLIYYKADTIILSLTQPESDVGIYGATYRVLEILTQFPYMFSGLILPILTINYAKNIIDFKRVFQKAFDFLVIAALPLVFGTIVVAGKIMTLVAGNEFVEAGAVLQIIILATAIIFVNTIFGYSIIVINKQRQMIPAYVLTAIVAVTGYFFLIPRYSYFGAAWMTVVAEALIFSLNIIMFYKTTKFFPKLTIIYKALLASLVMSASVYLLRDLHVGVIVIIAAIIYSVVLYLVKGVSRETISEIIHIRS